MHNIAMKTSNPQKHSDATFEHFGTLASGVCHQPQTQAFLSRFCPAATPKLWDKIQNEKPGFKASISS